jgi:ABC-type multidrug transport system fused ATPase/permease subunit
MLKSIRKNPYVAMLTTCWHYAFGEKRKFTIVYGLFILANLIHSIQPIIWGWFINELQRNGATAITSVWKYAGLYLLTHLLDWGLHGNARVQERQLAFNISRNYLQELYHQAVHLPVEWHQDHHSGSIISRVRKAYDAVRQFFQDGFRYINIFMQFLVSFVAMIYFSPLFGGVAIALGILAIWVIIEFDKPFIKYHNETNEREHLVSSNLFDSLSNIVTVITLRLEQRMENGLVAKIQNVFPPFIKKVVINEWKWFTVDTIVTIIYLTTIVGFVYQNYVPGEVFLIGGLVTLIGFVRRFTSVFHDMAWQYTQIVTFNTDVKTAKVISESYHKRHLADTDTRLPEDWEQLKINQLNFTHKQAKEEEGIVHGLRKIHLDIRRGKKIALIGESGSGKSTLLAILRGLYQAKPNATIELDGKTIEQADLIGNSVTLFPQEPEIFENTIEYNITLGLPATQEAVDKACQLAHFSPVIKQLPDGIATDIKEKGVNLSGGQKQRLALARGVLAAKESSIVLMDEPTSSVDPKTEALIYEALFRSFTDKAVISSLHRLHLLPAFDYIYLMDNGKIIAEGDFESLRRESKAFQEMWKHQEKLSQEAA